MTLIIVCSHLHIILIAHAADAQALQVVEQPQADGQAGLVRQAMRVQPQLWRLHQNMARQVKTWLVNRHGSILEPACKTHERGNHASKAMMPC